jgi:hypothetical protein
MSIRSTLVRSLGLQERKDDDLHKHVDTLRQHGYQVTGYARFSANRGHVATGPVGRNRMDKGRDPDKRQQGFYTDPHLSLRLSGPKGNASTWMYKGRSSTTYDHATGEVGRRPGRDDVATMLHGVKQRIPGVGVVGGYTTSDPNVLAKRLKTVKAQEAVQAAVLRAQGRTQTESVMTTIHHDFYGSRTGINNRIPMCPICNLPVRSSFYDNNHAAGYQTCQCGATDPDGAPLSPRA